MSLEFEELISTNHSRIMAIARQYCGENNVDDLYQEILEQLWRSFDSFKENSTPETWVYRVGFNTAMTHLRKVVRRRDGAHKLENLARNDISIGDRNEMEILEDFFDSLNEIDTSVLMMYLDGLTAEEMTEVLGVRRNAIEVRVSRLKQKFIHRYLEN